MPHDAQPAPGTGFVQGTVTRVVTMIHITHLAFQAIQNHFLEIGGKTETSELFLAAEISLLEGKGGEKGKTTKSLQYALVTLFEMSQSKGKEKGEPLKVVFLQET